MSMRLQFGEFALLPVAPLTEGGAASFVLIEDGLGHHVEGKWAVRRTRRVHVVEFTARNIDVLEGTF